MRNILKAASIRPSATPITFAEPRVSRGKSSWILRGKLSQAACAGVFLLLACPHQNLSAQQSEPRRQDRAETATAILREAAGAIATHAFRPDPPSEIAATALRELLYRLGKDEAPADTLKSLRADEALHQFGEQIASLAEEHGTVGELAERALALYVRAVDDYGAYIDSATQTLASRLDPDSSAGVGISLSWRSGEFFCHPIPGSPAERAGIVKGDRLVTVDGRDVAHTSLVEIGALARGEPGTRVELGILRAYGRTETLTLTRERQTTPWVLVERDLGEAIVRIRRIEQAAVEQMKTAFVEAANPSHTAVTLDLRGCPGGNFDAAISLAALFLPEGAPIGSLMERERRLDYHAAPGPRVDFSKLTILQDGGTGSAAELLIACLFENLGPGRIVTHSERTFGKAAVIASIPLATGGRLQITSGILYAPSGRTWERVGLLPSLGSGGRIFAADHTAAVAPIGVRDSGDAAAQPDPREHPPETPDPDPGVIEIIPMGKGTGRF